MTAIHNGELPHLSMTSSSRWVEIQKNTFRNWVNEQLKSKGLSIFDIRTDFDDGVLLSALAEVLQRKRIPGVVQKPSHNHEKLHNITVALDAIAKDNVTLINIDSSHITEGNTKMILALLWQLVLRYQIGLSNINNRSWLLAWVQAVIPDCHVTNLTVDWNSGIALHALLEFCKKGLSPDWRQLNPLDGKNNCIEAMNLARYHFGIPLILKPEHLASRELDELSLITYLSYFTKVGAPGYNGTLQRIQPLIRNYPVFNFTTDWNDGRVLCELVTVFGGIIPSWPDLKGTSLQRLKEGIEGAKRIGVLELLSAEDIVDESEEHLGIMAYAARFLTLSNGVVIYQHGYRDTKVMSIEDSGPRDTSSLSRVNETAPLKLLSNGYTNHKDNDSTSTISEPGQQQMEYTFVRTPSLRRKQKQDVHAAEGVKKDTYSDGVIIYATSHTVVSVDDIRLEAESPTGRLIKMNGDAQYHAQFGADEIGTWTVTLLINDKVVDNCLVDVCDPSQVIVSGLKAGLTGHPHQFYVDCSNAGKGKLEVDMTTSGRNVPCFLSQKSGKKYVASFTPLSSGHYLISLTYNKAEIREDAFSDPKSEELHRQAVFSTNIKQHHDHYKVTASCDWQIDYLTGGPIDLYIGDTADIKVYSMQDGTICNTPHLIADTTGALGGIIGAEVSYGANRFPAQVQEDSPGVYKIFFNPRGPGTYKVWVTYDGRLVKGSPFLQEIDELTSPSAEGPGLKRAMVAEPAKFNVDARGFPGQLSVQVQGPHYPILSTIAQNPDNTHTVTYVPEETGIHRINIQLDGKDIKGSPYHPKVVDPTRVRVSGGWGPLLDNQERIPLQVGKEKHIPFDASEAGPGELTGTVHGPSDKVPVTIDSRGDGKHTLIFTPKEEGKHYIDVNWNSFPLPKSPYLGFATPYIDEPDSIELVRTASPVQYRELVDRYPSDRKSEPPPGYWVRADRPTSPGPNKIYILAPTKSEPNVPQVESYRYPPTRIRVHRHGSDVGPKYKKPVHYAVPRRTPSLHSSTVSVKSEPRRKEPDVTITRLPRTSPMYRYDSAPTSEPYIYQTSPQSSSPPSLSPSYIYAKPEKVLRRDDGPSPKVILRGKGLKHAEVDKPAKFSIDGREAGPVTSLSGFVFLSGNRHVSFDESDLTMSGEPEAKVASIRSEPPVDIREVSPKQYDCTYTPRVPGAYLLDIKWNGKPLKCCPFKIDVHKPVYPERVAVTGEPLRKGVVPGKDFDLKIDPRQAGKGELTIDCKDPQGTDVPVTLTDNYDGTYRLKVKPEKPGKHILNIRLNKEHVFGSPYAIEVHPRQTSSNKPRELKVWGPGLHNGIFPDYEGHFYVDCTNAGGGELHVSVMGLKGAFRVEMKRGSQKDKLFNCLYHPVEPGLYTINVEWSGQHVKGSPFKVFVAGSEMELLDYENRFERMDLYWSWVPGLPRKLYWPVRVISWDELKVKVFCKADNAISNSSSSKHSPNTTQNSIMY